MLDFTHQVPTKIYFGKDTHKQVGEIISEMKISEVTIVHDGAPFLKTLLEEIRQGLEEKEIHVTELSGVQPNPRLGFVLEGIEKCREWKTEMLLAVGGGSTIDTAKGIAAGVPYSGDVWDFYQGKAPQEALPVGVVLTIPATGSECDSGSVITKEEGGLKRCANAPVLFPKFAVMNPEITYTLPPKQTAAGLADMYVHVAERYFSNTPNTYVIDSMCEGVFRTLNEIAPKIMEDPKNYDLRSESMWIATIAQNETLGVGREQDWGTHYLGHEISAKYDITHGVTMAILNIAWMKYVYKHDVDRFVRYGKYVFEIPTEGRSKEEVALEAIEKNAELYKKLGLPETLGELGVKEEDFEELAENALKENAFLGGNFLGAFVPLYKEDLVNILKLAI